MSAKRKLLISCAVLIILIAGVTFMWVSTSDATKYSPLSHKLSHDMFCRIVDKSPDSKYLIEHFNRDTNELTLSIYHSGEVVWLEHPHGKIENFKNAINENKISFKPDDDKMLIVNGEVFPIQPIP